MAVRIAPQSLGLRDNRGHVGRVRWNYQYDSAAVGGLANAFANNNAIITAMVALSNAAPVTQNGLSGVLLEPNNYGTSAQFANAEDKARLVFLAVDDDVSPVEQGFLTVEIPAPKLAIFYADQETVNSASTLMAAFITAALTADATGGSLATRSGLIIASFVGGYRRRRKLQRKITLWDRSSNLDEPEE